MNLNFEEESKKEKKLQIIKEVIRWAVEIAIVIFIAFLLVYFFMLRTEMLGSSMENTLNNGQEVIVNKAAYLIFSPSRYDIIAFYQTDEEVDYLVTFRRIIGLPGERVQIKEGTVYIDGEKLDEKYEMISMESGGLAENEVVLGEDEYFVLGDNRNNSEDSRFRSFGNVAKDRIIGEAIFKMDPFALVRGPSIE
ncbi:MAG: signal peptidase I [Lachnoclostridium sp.]|jgi:signal peptidase I|nr:signal peptidase I [Lachnoclostridium sp.]